MLIACDGIGTLKIAFESIVSLWQKQFSASPATTSTTPATPRPPKLSAPALLPALS